MIISILTATYILAAGGIALFAATGLATLVTYWRHRHDTEPTVALDDANCPLVTVQLPIYNERFVVGRLIDAAAQIDYPAGRLEIQIIDDSDDETTRIAKELVRRHRKAGLDIHYLNRGERSGYKAGALQYALERSNGEFIAIFDADFVPARDFLRKSIPLFVGRPDLGFTQARWGHLNADNSLLTATQAIALDKHFAMEQYARHQASLFPKFNGSAGIWRRQAIIDAGGWETDTVCEDLCLSTRAALQGWRGRYLNQVVAPAELPETVTALKNQQRRWATGSTQCLLKFGRRILVNDRNPVRARLYGLMAMAGYLTFPLVLILLLVQVPLLLIDFHPPAYLLLFALIGIGQPMLFIMGQKTLHRDWLQRLGYLPALLAVGVGMAPIYTRAIISGLTGHQQVFVRTPKRGLVILANSKFSRSPAKGYRLPWDKYTLLELLLAVYATAGILVCISRSNFGPVPFLLTCALGLGYVSLSGLYELAGNRIRPQTT